MIYLIITVYCLLFLFLFLLMEVFKRKNILSAEWTRRVVHVISACIAYTLPLYLPKQGIIFLCLIFLLVLIFSKYKNIFTSIHEVKRSTLGEIFFPVGVLLCALLTLPNHVLGFQCAILILGISDTGASIIGSRFGRHSFSIFKARKSIEGSLTFFMLTFIICMFFGFSFLPAVAIAFMASVAESVSPYGLDNISIPLTVSLIFYFFAL